MSHEKDFKRLRLLSSSEQNTEEIAAHFASELEAGAFVAIRGNLGAGKTAFVRGIAKALGDDSASSPTFGIVHEYDTNPPIFHFDVYRLSGEEDLETIGFDEYLYRCGIILMEWPERIENALPKKRIDISIKRLDEEKREFIIEYLDA